jgi:hypothetical protein
MKDMQWEEIFPRFDYMPTNSRGRVSKRLARRFKIWVDEEGTVIEFTVPEMKATIGFSGIEYPNMQKYELTYKFIKDGEVLAEESSTIRRQGFLMGGINYRGRGVDTPLIPGDRIQLELKYPKAGKSGWTYLYYQRRLR